MRQLMWPLLLATEATSPFALEVKTDCSFMAGVNFKYSPLPPLPVLVFHTRRGAICGLKLTKGFGVGVLSLSKKLKLLHALRLNTQAAIKLYLKNWLRFIFV
jgi:hypothetical protein